MREKDAEVVWLSVLGKNAKSKELYGFLERYGAQKTGQEMKYRKDVQKRLVVSCQRQILQSVCQPMGYVLETFSRRQARKGDPPVAHTTRAPAPLFYPGWRGGWGGGGLAKSAGRLGLAPQG
jgi:hypothetical protein